MQRTFAIALFAAGAAAQECSTYSLESVCPAPVNPFKDSFEMETRPAGDDESDQKCKGSARCRSKLSPWQESRFLGAYNTYRRHHGACNLEWSQTITDFTLNSPGFQAMCNGGDITKKNSASDLAKKGLSEMTIALDSGLDSMYAYDMAKAPFTWYCLEESCFKYSESERTVKSLNFTGLVWKGASEIGCGICQQRKLGKAKAFLMCHTKAETNVEGEFAANVGSPDTTTCTAEEAASEPKETIPPLPTTAPPALTILPQTTVHIPNPFSASTPVPIAGSALTASWVLAVVLLVAML